MEKSGKHNRENTNSSKNNALSPKKFIDPMLATTRSSIKAGWMTPMNNDNQKINNNAAISHFIDASHQQSFQNAKKLTEKCPYNTSTTKQMFSFPKSSRFPNFVG